MKKDEEAREGPKEGWWTIWMKIALWNGWSKPKAIGRDSRDA